ncbi:MAG: AraC family transcriptional regulator [Intestinibacter bartlettii]|uniref:AraC family transcriptional regulator n=1 Tax=Intestinibacter bartlettii TaxID=261299 RepID=UPI0026F19043|nr:AraC family transcriptional regulator [Intestinibacter bartlettii]MDO5010031.1 AraC family transcriptional regulator [Intestinibacter bartlettii]
MQSDILDYTIKLLSKCIPVKVRQFKKSTLEYLYIDSYSDFSSMINYYLTKCLKTYLNQCQNSVITNIITPFNTQYYTLCISKEHDEHLMIGPFLENPITGNLVYEIISNLQLSLDYAAKLKLYYQSVPSIDSAEIFEILYTINEYITGNSNPPKIHNLDLSILSKQDSSYDIFSEDMNRTSMYKILEERYILEGKLLSYITKGDINRAQAHFEKFNSNIIEISNASDSIRDIKNLLLSGNTLFRKASHMGGVPPIYLDELSRKWAKKIEHAPSFEALNSFAPEMVRSYCLLTKKHSLSQFSPTIKDTFNFINLNLSSNLTVKKVANEIGLSPDHLTRLFKKETGMNIITYINKKRIDTALELLKTTDLSIAEIGDLIGLNNTSYFYTLFKKETGMSPKQYRSSLSSK